MKVVQGLYYPYSENKGADQLRGYREADLRLCFRICKKPVFSRHDSNIIQSNLLHSLISSDMSSGPQSLTRLHICSLLYRHLPLSHLNVQSETKTFLHQANTFMQFNAPLNRTFVK